MLAALLLLLLLVVLLLVGPVCLFACAGADWVFVKMAVVEGRRGETAKLEKLPPPWFFVSVLRLGSLVDLISSWSLRSGTIRPYTATRMAQKRGQRLLLMSFLTTSVITTVSLLMI
ncbi:hypothetical protein B0T24DRAFT_597407 [Lasiosphaeria ovina]|uniref:Secreted peptide n=1 Tax=Lasiosphaeria ovina TaxID=92902 RepID=A0AAE0JWG1_9PEZI|nr:hypothetical protein B0T24DRAFT_597407 [Lasiosphaeria ovina]